MLELAELVIQFFGLMIRGVFLVLGAIFELAANLLPELPNIDVPDGISSTVEGAAEIADNLRRNRSGDDPPA
ncbi:hypothetical protein LOC68_05690 [Blastopirellula sp. JC732]|uniref:Uncharacterized protein n=1 Tax=Blastopirellula sediminis TaxID=2894196 RepID=A0A9X1MJB4_9BACT|nr:hypothetical protein [Blastopirellula sediminis]MCC9609344.1 hypothetical protein [Blastopirellula sediminis]MCC9627879.1 hypothetical protein [Blastopirellula sediminis]